jgi:hypothetical protein
VRTDPTQESAMSPIPSAIPSIDRPVAAAPRPAATLRLACAAAALATTATLAAALLGSWHASSPPLWLAATPEVMAEVARCEQLAGFERQMSCKQEIVAARLPVEAQWVRLARH